MLTPPRRGPAGLPFVLFAGGLALALYFGEQWWRMPVPSAADLEEATEAQLALALAQRGPHLQPDEAGLQRLRAQVKAEVQGKVHKPLEQAQRGFGLGAILAVIGLGQLVFARLSQRR